MVARVTRLIYKVTTQGKGQTMVAVKLPIFSGMVPSIDPHLLSDQNASFCNNAWLYSGALVGLPDKEMLHEMVNPAATIAYRIPIYQDDPTYLFDSVWVEFENNLTDFVSAPVAEDQYRRFYWAAPNQPTRYNTFDRIQNGLPPFLLGLPSPNALNVTVTGGSSATNVSRAYVATFVTEYGEEGPASEPSLINGKEDATFEITLPAALPDDLGVNRNIKKIRLYRTIVSSAGTTTYYRVIEMDALATTQSFTDIVTDATLASMPILESTAWTAPPALEGMVSMPNGIMAGYVGNTLYFSEPYRPHSWPAAYSLTIDYDVVGMSVTGQTLVVCTKGNPITASGVNPASITTSKLAVFEPCLSKGSILPTEEGVYYTSPNGLILVNAGIIQNITKQFISRDQWASIAYKGKVNAGRFNGAYFAYGAGIEQAYQDAFQEDFAQTMPEDEGSPVGVLIDPSNANMGFTYISTEEEVKSVKNDAFSGELVYVSQGKVFWLPQDRGYHSVPYVWRSKIFQPPVKLNFSAVKIYFYDDPSIQTPNPQNVDLNQTFDPATQKGLVRIFADGVLISTQEFRRTGELLRLPAGFKADFWQIEIEAQVKVKSFQMSTSVKELSIV